MAKRKGGNLDDSHFVGAYLVEHGLAEPNLHPSFIRNNYLRELYVQLHTNVLYSWLRGDLGQIDKPTITKDMLWNTWRDMNLHGFFTAGYITTYYVDKEMLFWTDMFPNNQRGSDGSLVEVIEIDD